ncbi:MAG: hypothetical protein ACJ73N_08080 [Bryobacteraceae bacterium]
MTCSRVCFAPTADRFADANPWQSGRISVFLVRQTVVKGLQEEIGMRSNATRSRIGLNAANFPQAEAVSIALPILNTFLKEAHWRYDQIGIAAAAQADPIYRSGPCWSAYLSDSRTGHGGN